MNSFYWFHLLFLVILLLPVLSFLFTLRGWAQFRAAALEVSTGQTYANGLGRAVLKDLGRHLSV